MLDDEAAVRASLAQWRALRARGHELIVVDGGSRDESAALASGAADTVVNAPRGRASQMNAGAARARGDALLFLHADTVLPGGAGAMIHHALVRRGALWGRFDVRLDDRRWPFRVIERAMNLRSRLTGIATGDQALFVDRSVFEAHGGYPDIELMEDVALSAGLRRRGAPACLRAVVSTSPRRWQRDGILRTVVLMWRLRLAYALGADPTSLSRIYHR